MLILLAALTAVYFLNELRKDFNKAYKDTHRK